MILAHLKTNLKSAGFTMIELLIVMGILSVLAVGVLAAIDPVEQLNKSRDTGARSDAKNLLDAVERYYAVKEYYPWNTASSQANSAYNPSSNPITGGVTSVVNRLEVAGEVKSTFSSRISKYISGDQDLVMYKANNSDAVWVCFTPRSKAFSQEAAARCPGPAGYPSGQCASGSERICIP